MIVEIKYLVFLALPIIGAANRLVTFSVAKLILACIEFPYHSEPPSSVQVESRTSAVRHRELLVLEMRCYSYSRLCDVSCFFYRIILFRVARLVRDQTNLEGIPIPVGLRSGSFDRVLDMWWAMGSVWFVFLPCGGIFLELRALVYSRVFIKPTFATTPTNKQCGQIGPLSCNRAYTPNMQSHQLEQITWFEIDRLGITT